MESNVNKYLDLLALIEELFSMEIGTNDSTTKLLQTDRNLIKCKLLEALNEALDSSMLTEDGVAVVVENGKIGPFTIVFNASIKDLNFDAKAENELYQAKRTIKLLKKEAKQAERVERNLRLAAKQAENEAEQTINPRKGWKGL